MVNKTIYLFLLTALFCCQKKEVEPILAMPQTTITGALSLNETLGLVRASLSEVSASNAEEYGVVWGLTPEPDISGNKKFFPYTTGVYAFSTQLENLTLGQTYYVRSYVRSTIEVIYSETASFIHQGPFVWQPLSSVTWSDRQHEAYGTVVNGAVYVIRPISQADTEVWVYVPTRDEWVKGPNLAITSTRYEPLYFTMNKFGDEAVFIAGGYRINEDVPGSQVFLREHFGFSMTSNFKGFDYFDFPFGNSLLTHFVLDDRAYVLSMDKDRKFAEFQWGILWNEKKPFPGEFLGRYVSFAIGTKGYVLVESSGRAARTKDFYEYDPEEDSWSKKADFPGRDRVNGIAFSVDGKGYYGAGEAKDVIEGLKDLWQYNPEEDKWEKFSDFPGSGNVKLITNTIADKVYIGLGFRIENSPVGALKYSRAYDYWQFSPKGNTE